MSEKEKHDPDDYDFDASHNEGEFEESGDHDNAKGVDLGRDHDEDDGPLIDDDEMLPEHEALLAANSYKKPLFKRTWFIIVAGSLLFFAAAYIYFAFIATPKKQAEGFDQASFGVQQESPQVDQASAPPTASMETPPIDPAAMPTGATPSPGIGGAADLGAPATAAPQATAPVAAPAVAPQPSAQMRPSAELAPGQIPDSGQMKAEMGKLYETVEQQMKHIGELERRVRALESRRSSSSERRTTISSVGKTSAKKETKEAPEVAPAADSKSRGRAVLFELTQYQLRSVRPGQAWIMTKEGLKIYNEGEYLPGNERVTKIDPQEMKVETDKGFIRFR